MNVIDERAVTLAEVKVILEKTDKEYKAEEKEFLYEQKRALDHAKKYAKLGLNDARELVSKLGDIEPKLEEEQIIKIVDLLPETVDDVRAIFAKERFKYSEEDIKKVIELVSKYR